MPTTDEAAPQPLHRNSGRRILTNVERATLSKWRRKHRIHRRTVSLTDQQLDRLEELGYLDPGYRGAPEDEAEALQAFFDERLNG